MANAYKVLGQLTSAAATLETLYTVPASTEAVVSTIVLANRSATAAAVRVAVRPAGAAIIDEHYIYFDVVLPGNDSLTLTIGITLEATDVISIQSDNATVSTSAFGQEIT